MRQGIKGPDEPGGSAGLGSGPFGGPNQQISFLQQDLASVDRAVTRKFRGNLLSFFLRGTWQLIIITIARFMFPVAWLVVGGHRP